MPVCKIMFCPVCGDICENPDKSKDGHRFNCDNDCDTSFTVHKEEGTLLNECN